MWKLLLVFAGGVVTGAAVSAVLEDEKEDRNWVPLPKDGVLPELNLPNHER